MSLLYFLRRASLLAGATVSSTLWYWRDDLTQLHFEAASAAGPLLRLFDPETAHNIGLFTAKHGLWPRETRPDPPSLGTLVWGRQFSNPIGVAAGFDKNAEAAAALLHMGFGFTEIGSVTPLPQPGNPKPRAFRLSQEGAIINRYGFNNAGAEVVGCTLQRLRDVLREEGAPKGLVGVNLGKNKETQDAAADYCIGVQRLGQYADYLVINVSSPNTPGLRALQDRRALEQLVARVKRQRDGMQWGPQGPPPLLVKVAPDLTSADLHDVAQVALRSGIDGLIVSNTTITRPPSVDANPLAQEAGGLSGAPLFNMSTEVLSHLYKLTKGKVPIIGCGGVSSGEDAYKKIRAGASLVQLYTALAYQGPRLVPQMKLELAACLERDGFTSVQQAIGADHRR